MAAEPNGSNEDWGKVLDIRPGQIIQELGWDDDCDPSVSEGVEDFLGESLVDEETDEVVDVVLLWWREHDGDLVDALVDAISPLVDGGVIWLLTPKTGRPGYVEPSDIQESANTAGLAQTSTASLGNWAGWRLAQGRAGGRR